MTEGLEQYREQAAERLGEQWRTGRLDAGEHERRTTALRHAASTDEIAAIERGELPSGAVSPIPPVAQRGAVEPAPDAAAAPPPSRGISKRTFAAIRSATPLVAVILFFLLNDVVDHAWVFFLLIPLVWTVLPYFMEVDTDGRRERRREIKRARSRSARDLER